MDERTCTTCAQPRPFPDGYAKDSRRPEGRRSECKACERKRTRDRRAGRTPKPGALALVLAPKFPAPPEDPSPQEAGSEPSAPTRQQGGAGTYSEAAEDFIAALDPPAGDADALLVRSLRGLADLADRYSYGADIVKDVNSLVASMVRVQRELAATRAAKGKAASAAESAPKSKLGRFGAASA